MDAVPNEDFPAKGPGSRRRRVVFLSLSAVVALAVIVLFSGALAMVAAPGLARLLAWSRRARPAGAARG